MTRQKPKAAVEICILAGGLSSRMGRDKSRVRLGRRTMLGHVRATAAQLHLPVRVLRRDAVPRCGPLGGIYTALSRSRADAILFLACDMPFITHDFLNQMLKTFFSRQHINVRKFPPRSSSPPLPRGEGRGEGKKPALTSIILPFSAALFASHNRLIGLPCILQCETALPIVSGQFTKSQFSLQSLARALKAKTITPSRDPSLQLLNLNTSADVRAARALLP